jgi:DNA-binding GntR family transcriptional regulator
VAEAITKGLSRREYAVGQRLVEADLTARLGVGRSTVREALKILASKGVVQIVPHRGAEIRGLALQDARDLLVVLEVLTGLAARLAAERIKLGRNKALFLAAARPLVQPRGADGLDSMLDQRARFYQSMFEVAGNAELERAMPTWRAHLFRTQFYGVLTRADLKAMVREYGGITEAIVAGDAKLAERRTRAHLRRTAERTLPHLQ